MSNFLARKQQLEACIEETGYIALAKYVVTEDAEAAEEFFAEALAAGCEGIIAKDIGEESFYRAGARGWQWIKLKRDYKSEMIDTVDLVIVGAFAGYGRRTGVYGALLMAVYDPEQAQFPTICKLGTGFTDEMLAHLHQLLEDERIDEPSPKVRSEMKADYWFTPKYVLEVVGAEITLSPIHTCASGRIRQDSGLAIRFPRFTGRIRDDKGPEDATTVTEVVDMYHRQLKTINS